MATNRHELEIKQQVLLELVKAGLWERNVELRKYGTTDFSEILRLATEQSVVGLVAAGLEHVTDVRVPQEWALQFVGLTLQIEQRNKAMNQFIADIVKKMRTADIYTLLVKGQGVAQCYEKPLWRPSGDVDFLLSEENYKKAKVFLLPLSSENKNEERYSQHLGMSVGQWYVEIHGSLRTGLSARVDQEVDKVINSVFYGGNVRSWDNDGVLVFLPAPTEDVFLVFTHFIKHFYKEGVSLKQVCDWCRLLYTYRESLNYGLLEKWVRKAGLMEEWKAFYNLASKYMGMPGLGSRLTDVESATPRHSSSKLGSAHGSTADFMIHDSQFDRKAERLMAFILGGYSGNKMKDTWQIAKIFPWKALRYSPSIFLNVNGLKIKERIFS